MMFTQRSRDTITVNDVYTTLPWHYNSDVENVAFMSFHLRAKEVSKSEVVEKVIPVDDFWMSADDMCQKL